uniref:Starch synthase, chloroplastic/amyloplastic n=2 Tax=Eleusine coracana TaxID=4511 RepID=A0A1V0CMG8_ELECO|nr:starch synthase [Eleusine coracana]
MSALAASQLGTTHAGFGIADRSAPSSAFRLHGVTAARPRVPAGAEAPLAMRTGAARPTPPRHARRTQQQRPGGRRLPSLVVCAAATGGMNIVFVGAEMAPWSKTGGLGDVLGGLPPAMAANGHRVMVISPRYDQYKDAWDTSVVAEIKVADQYERVRFFHCYKRGVDRVFIDHPSFLEKVWGKTGEKIYGPDTGVDYKDNQMRFSLLCQAALEAPRILNLNSNPYFSGPYGEDVVFVCNDWHTGPLLCYLKTNYHPNGNYRDAKVAFCIHNISYQGRFALADFGELNLPERFKSSFDFLDGYDTPVEGRKINWMKAGILEADRVLTVSPYYAQELISGEARGCELDNHMRLTGITGIVNGMDVSEWDPSKDKYIAVKYDEETAMEAKALNKEALQAAVGLPVDRKIPLIAFVGRLEEQKGPDVMAAAIPEILEEEDVQIVLLGTGKKKFERLFKAAEEKYPDKVAAIVKFNAPLAHHIMAGADLLAVTSRFEPCGLIQLQGMRYGTPCACASTGGLVDTVVEGKTGFQMGRLSVDCKVVEPADVKKVTTTLKRAIKVVGTPAYNEMVRNCMTQDLSWKGPAKNWENVLLSMGVAGSEPGIEGEEIAPLARENVAAP